MITVAAIKSAVAEAHRIPVDKLSEATQQRKYSWPRQEGYLLSRELTRHSLPRIGQFFGHRDHSTVVKGIRAARDRYATDAEVRRRIDSLSVGLLIS